MTFSPMCRINGVCETQNVFEIQTSKNIQQYKWLLHFAAFYETLLQTSINDWHNQTEMFRHTTHNHTQISSYKVK